jgi:hypothetical protein
VCGPACEAEARARILLRIHGSLAAAFRRALREWQNGTGQAGVMVALRDRAAGGGRPMHPCSNWYGRLCGRHKTGTMRRLRMC